MINIGSQVSYYKIMSRYNSNTYEGNVVCFKSLSETILLSPGKYSITLTGSGDKNMSTINSSNLLISAIDYQEQEQIYTINNNTELTYILQDGIPDGSYQCGYDQGHNPKFCIICSQGSSIKIIPID